MNEYNEYLPNMNEYNEYLPNNNEYNEYLPNKNELNIMNIYLIRMNMYCWKYLLLSQDQDPCSSQCKQSKPNHKPNFF